MATTCYYQILEVTKEATPEQIKQSYKKLALKHHPDKNIDKQQAKINFTKISEAYTVLSDPQKKGFYDQYGTADMESMAYNFDFESFFATSFDDFEEFLNEAMFSNLTMSFGKGMFKGEKGAKNSKRNKRTKNSSGMGGLNKIFNEMMEMSEKMFEEPKSKPKSKAKGSKQQQEDDDWETDSEDENQDQGGWQDVDSDMDSDSDDMPSEFQLTMLPVYIQQHSTTTKKNKKKVQTCSLDDQKFKNNEDLVEHFCQNHMKQFKAWMKTL